MDALDSLLDTLLFEGYALYPYTPSAAKNATPTPFGIVYPPAYAERTAGAFDSLRLHGIVQGDTATQVHAEVRFLEAAPAGGHRAVERRLSPKPGPLVELAARPHTEHFDLGGLAGRTRLAAKPLFDDVWRIALCVHNTSALPDGEINRGAALRHSLLSTHPILRVTDGTFVSPLEREGELGEAVGTCACVNTYPVLATPEDDVLLGAAIVLPDHPELAPESRGDLFDGTEIEEALLLHVLALSEPEREQIAAADPAVRAMIERAAAATPEELTRLHGRTVLSDPEPGEDRA
jgi:hypothetical protein